MVHDDTRISRTRDWNYFKDDWHYAGGLSAVNAIGTQIDDLIN